MNLPLALLTIRWMVRETFRQSLASRLFWVMLGISLISALFCLSVSVSGDTRLPTSDSDIELRLSQTAIDELGREKSRSAPGVHLVGGGLGLQLSADALGREVARSEGIDAPGGRVTFGFGVFEAPLGRDRRDAVRWLEIILAGAVADTIGLFLVLIWTAGFVPTFFDPNQATILLAKPVPRWSLVVGKFVGVLIFVGLQAGVFVGLTWLALGAATGVFDPTYLLTVPLVIIHFAIFYSFSVLLGIWTRNAVICVLGTILFWAMCWGMNFARHAVIAHQVDNTSVKSSMMLEVGYWVLPKPGDMSIVVFQVLKDGSVPDSAFPVPEFAAVLNKKVVYPELSMLASLAFSALMLAIAARELHQVDY